MERGDKVRIKKGEHEGRIGELVGSMPMSQVQNLTEGQDISMEGAKLLWVVQLDDGKKQTVIEETDLVIMYDRLTH